MSPTVFRYWNYRFCFFSREVPRMHMHVLSPDGDAKFWLAPGSEYATAKGFRTVELSELQRIIEGRQDEIMDLWRWHFTA